MDRIKIALFLVFVCLSFSACSGEKIVHWTQEVQLQDGRVIEVDRVSKQKGPLMPENVIIEYEQTLSFTNPDNSEKIVWTIPNGLRPRMLDFLKGKPYVVFRAGSVADYNTWGCPNPPHVIFAYEGGQWKQISIDDLPEIFTYPNVLDAAHSADKLSEDGLVTVEEMRVFLRASQFADRRIISREKVSPVGLGCFESTLYKLGRQSEIQRGR